MRFTQTVTVRRPAEDVFTALTDVERACHWQRGLESSYADGPIAVGTQVMQRRRLLAAVVDTAYEVSAYDPPRHAEVRSVSGPLDFVANYLLAETPAGTHVTASVELRTCGLPRLARAALMGAAGAEARASLTRLAALLEQRDLAVAG